MEINEITQATIGAAMEVHRTLGPGLLESVYEECLFRELSHRGVPFARQSSLPMEYKGVRLECGYRTDIVIANAVLVELKSVEELQAVA